MREKVLHEDSQGAEVNDGHLGMREQGRKGGRGGYALVWGKWGRLRMGREIVEEKGERELKV